MILCVQLGHPNDAAVGAIAECVPRLAVEAGARVWVDVRGLDATALFTRVCKAARRHGVECRGGIAVIPVAAQMAASACAAGEVQTVAPGTERTFVAGFALRALDADDGMLAMLEGVGISECSELAALPREAVEVRFGPEAVALWRLSRADDERRLFRPQPPESPHASIDFIDYVVTDPERLLFTANALLGTICDALVERGSHARNMLITLPLADGTRWQRELRPARATADRAVWLRMLRSLLERLTVSDSVAGMHLEVRAAQAATAVQGDLFDSGFATASAVEEAVTRLLEQHEDVIVRPVVTEHPLIEARVTYEPATFGSLAALVRETGVRDATAGATSDACPGELTLQLLQQPKPILADTVRRRDHEIPVRYRDGSWHSLLHVSGPDRLSGGQWDQSYAREYYRAVTTEGTLVWLFRDACKDKWYLHGWWD
jgi:hypothetical protein